ncbi:MAG: hypothetical protein QM220_06575 [Atribacterota bacterium]|nr:hypothetical protein [Atribacterota bacterium]
MQPISPKWGGVGSGAANISQLGRGKKVVCPKSPQKGMGGESSMSKVPL